MFPFSSCICQDYNNWLITFNNPLNQKQTNDDDQPWDEDFDKNLVKVRFLCPYDHGEYIVPDVAVESVVTASVTESGQNRKLKTDCDTNFVEHFPIVDKSEFSVMKCFPPDFRNRLVKIQRMKKYVKRRQSINCYRRIHVCNPDKFGMVDLTDFSMTEEYLDRYLNSWKFNVFRLNRFTGGNLTLVKFGLKLFEYHGLMDAFELDVDYLKRFLHSIQEVYHNSNPYHNSLHSVDVAQAMHCFLTDIKIKSISDPLDVLGCIIAAFCHDADHPGLNQLYLEKINHFFVSLYSHCSVLENHHIRVTVSLLHQSRLLNRLSADSWQYLVSLITHLILATDITHQKLFLNKFIKFNHDKRSLAPVRCDLALDERILIYQLALKCSDISNPCRCWPVTLGWASLVCEEFFMQGDVEKKQGLSVLPSHDRCMTTKADIQLSFIRFIVRPLVNQWNLFLKSKLSSSLVSNVDSNLISWETYKQRYSVASAKSISSPSPKVEINLPTSISPTQATPISGLATLTEETTLTSSCVSKPFTNAQRRFSLPEKFSNPIKVSQRRQSTTIMTYSRSTSHTGTTVASCRRGSLPPHLKSNPICFPKSGRRRGSLPLNVRPFPIPSAWEEEPNTPNVRPCSVVRSSQFTTNMQQRRGSAPLIGWSRSGLDCSLSANSQPECGLITSCSREKLLLEVYWMAASSSVSSSNSINGLGSSPSTIQQLSSGNMSQSNPNSTTDNNSGVVIIR